MLKWVIRYPCIFDLILTIHWVKYFINYSSNRKRWRFPCHHFLHITYWHQCQQIHLPYFQQYPPLALMSILFIYPPLALRTKGWMTPPDFDHSILSFNISGEKYNQLPVTVYFLSNQLKIPSSFISWTVVFLPYCQLLTVSR